MMEANVTKKNKKPEENGLVNVVFSWSLTDVLNNKLYKHEVKDIPMTFTSTDSYMNSFIHPLLEETRFDLSSCLKMVACAPTCKIYGVETSKGHKPPKDLYYDIYVERLSKFFEDRDYQPEFGDLIAFTDAKPKCVDDLNKPQKPYLIGFVMKMDSPNKLKILCSKPIVLERYKEKDTNRISFVAVFLTNLNTNIRIWKALKSDPKGGNMKIIKSVTQIDNQSSEAEINCSKCLPKWNRSVAISYAKDIIGTFNLDDSQEDAVLSCLRTRECNHQNTVKLIWGPPGTGKTKTVAALLLVLFKLKGKALTCAPTNTAVLGVAKRLVSIVSDALEYDAYGLGDIVLLGNGERMKIDDHEDLFDVFLQHRVKILSSCFAPVNGWKGSVQSITNLFEDPEKLYCLYSEEQKRRNDMGKGEEKESGIYANDFGDTDRKKWNSVIAKTLKEGKTDKHKKSKKKGEKKKSEQIKIMTFEEFFVMKFKFLRSKMMFLLINMCTHIPTSVISLEQAKKMIRAFELLKSLSALLDPVILENGRLRQLLKSDLDVNKGKLECLEILKYLMASILIPEIHADFQIQRFCLQNARLIFCTASSSCKLHAGVVKQMELVIIDEAAQLKECESTIPFQVPGLCHAILIGDERQLPAMVQSELCKNAEFGRSLFERLVKLGHSRHLLQVQYRMHPSISLFPKQEFYENKILDGPNVKQPNYEKRFLQGKMYGAYSFINVTHGKEGYNSRHSTKNLVEVAVVAEIVANLFQESKASKHRLRVGCLSPYEAQVFAMQERLGKRYSTDVNSNFSVSIRSVDGFQGGEEDVIIISTVRCNARGSVGFLSNRQRTNVALTRARYCLWILGNGATLANSDSVWGKLVLDAEKRGCAFNASEDKNLSRAITWALIELNQLDILRHPECPLFCNARWKIIFSDEFVESIARIKSAGTRKEVFLILEKISTGWRRRQKDTTFDMEGTCLELLEMYKVNESCITWSVDLVKEDVKEYQVIKVWDILPFAKILNMKVSLNKMFSSYSAESLYRCKYKKLEGMLVVPMTWQVGAREAIRSDADDYIKFLEKRVASLSLGNEKRKKEKKKKKKKKKNEQESSTNRSHLESTESKPAGKANDSRAFRKLM